MPRWKVTLNGAGGWQVFGIDGRCAARFHTHAEAVAYAHRMARTREVVLPRGVNEVSVGPNAWLELRADGGASVHGGCGSTGIRKYALERTALALLAHARKDAT